MLWKNPGRFLDSYAVHGKACANLLSLVPPELHIFTGSDTGIGGSIQLEGIFMEEKSLRPRERQVVELLLQGCDNDEISRQLHMARRTVKAHFNRLFVRFGITGGVKRVKLATFLYRRQLCSEQMEAVPQTTESNELSSSSPKDSKIEKSQMKSAPLNTSSKTISAPSTTNWGSGTA
jgi:DNA-binding CsgD family transcriptional regulator